MYNFRLETLLYFARIRQLRGTFRSAAFYGFGDLYDPCIVLITVQSGVMLSCTIYNRYSQVIKVTEVMMNVLQYTTVTWTYEDAESGYTYGQTSSPHPPAAPPLPNLDQSAPTPAGPKTIHPQYRKTMPLNNSMRNPPHPDQFQTDTMSYPPSTKNPTRPFTPIPESHYPTSAQNNESTQNQFLNLIPQRLRPVPRSEVLQWKGNIKSIYMRTNGINTMAQIATMLSLPVADVLQILRQLEKEGLISLRRPL